MVCYIYFVCSLCFKGCDKKDWADLWHFTCSAFQAPVSSCVFLPTKQEIKQLVLFSPISHEIASLLITHFLFFFFSFLKIILGDLKTTESTKKREREKKKTKHFQTIFVFSSVV